MLWLVASLQGSGSEHGYEGRGYVGGGRDFVLSLGRNCLAVVP